MSTRVLLPISDWKSRLLGKRLTTPSSDFIDEGGAPVYHKSPSPTIPNLQSSLLKPPLLLQLPPELRLRILELVFESISPMDWLSCHHGATPASVIFVCKQFYIEGRKMAVEKCTFPYEELPEHEKRMMIRWDYAIADDYCSERLNAEFNEKGVCDLVHYGQISFMARWSERGRSQKMGWQKRGRLELLPVTKIVWVGVYLDKIIRIATFRTRLCLDG